MIFIINETESTKKIVLQTDIVGESICLSANIGDSSLMILHVGKYTGCGKALHEKFQQGEEIRNKNVSRHNIKVDDAHILYDKPLMCVSEEDVAEKNGFPDPDTFDSSVRMVEVYKNKPMPKRYTTSKDIIVVIHNPNDTFWMKHDHLLFNEAPYIVTDERSELQATVFPVKWYNWSRLKEKVYIYKGCDNNEDKSEPCYKLSHTTGKIENSTINMIRKVVNKDKKK